MRKLIGRLLKTAVQVGVIYIVATASYEFGRVSAEAEILREQNKEEG